MDVLPRQTADAVVNMSADLLLLDHYPQPDHIRFRPFAWSDPAYTFGVSQPWAKYRPQVPTQYPLVRRCTGGGLVSHLDDWTFALVIPSSHRLFKADAMAAYAAVHEALGKALQAQGQPVKLAPAPAGTREFHAPDSCALRVEPNDLVRSDDGRKVAGAAQKRNRHGLLIEGYVWRPFLTGCDWLRFEKDFATALGQVLDSSPVAVAEPVYNQFDHEGTWAKFASPEWNQRI
jgi:lipoate-protein ligase A